MSNIAFIITGSHMRKYPKKKDTLTEDEGVSGTASRDYEGPILRSSCRKTMRNVKDRELSTKMTRCHKATRTVNDKELPTLKTRCRKVTHTVKPVPLSKLEALLFDKNPDIVMSAVSQIRKMLSLERKPPIDEVLSVGKILPRLVEILDFNHSPGVQFESACSLTIIVSGTSAETRAVVAAGAVAPTIRLLSSSTIKVAQQAVWILSNIAGDGPDLRDLVINSGAIEPMLRLVNPTTHVQFLRCMAWAISNLCRNKTPPPPASAVRQILPLVARLLDHNDVDILADTCCALSYLTDGANDTIGDVVNAGVVPKLIHLLESPEVRIMSWSLKVVGNLVMNNDQTQYVIDNGVLSVCPDLLSHERSNIQKGAAWLVSNITAGNVNQIQEVIDADVLPHILRLLAKGDLETQKHCAYLLRNISSGGYAEQILMCTVFTPSLCELLVVDDAELIYVVLETLKLILDKAAAFDKLLDAVNKLKECGGVGKIVNIQSNKNKDISASAISLIEAYFPEEVGEYVKLTDPEWNSTAASGTDGARKCNSEQGQIEYLSIDSFDSIITQLDEKLSVSADRT